MFKAITKIALILSLAIGFTSCSKDKADDGSNAYHMKLKRDNADKSFSTAVTAMKTQMGDGYNLVIVGLDGTKSTFNVVLYSADDFKSGDAFTADADDMSTYNDLAWAEDVQNSNETKIWSSFTLYSEGDPEMQVKITEINSEFVKGTFSGKISQNIEGGASKVITNGSFKAKFSY